MHDSTVATVETNDPILNSKRMVQMMIDKFTGKPYVRKDQLGKFFLTGFDSLGCYCYALCDENGTPLL